MKNEVENEVDQVETTPEDIDREIETEVEGELEMDESDEQELKDRELEILREFYNDIERLDNEIEALEDQKKTLSSRIKGLEAEKKGVASACKDDLSRLGAKEELPLIDFSQKKPEPERDPDEWMNFLAKDHLDLTESEFNKIAPDGMGDKLTLADVENIRKKLSDGEKLKGVGPALRQKLDDQMIEVVAKFCTPVAEEPKSVPVDISDLLAESEENPVERDESLVVEFIEGIESLLQNALFHEQADFLQGVLDWVQENRVYTKKQRNAVYNIEHSMGD